MADVNTLSADHIVISIRYYRSPFSGWTIQGTDRNPFGGLQMLQAE